VIAYDERVLQRTSPFTSGFSGFVFSLFYMTVPAAFRIFFMEVEPLEYALRSCALLEVSCRILSSCDSNLISYRKRSNWQSKYRSLSK
jgi:hypothetical protein